MNDRERQICSRLKNLRRSVGWSQYNFAVLLALSHDRFASLEYGRTPLKFETALAAAMATGCNLVWLAEGIGPMFGPLPSLEILSSVRLRALFSTAWKSKLKPLLPAGSRDFGQSPVQEWPSGGASVESYLCEEVTGTVTNLPPQFHPAFFAHVTHACRDFTKRNQALINNVLASSKKYPSKLLTEAASSGMSVAVKPKMPGLLDRLNRATRATGKMSALADFLTRCTGQNVPLASVSRWLSGAREPGGEIALLMLHWVENQERQK